jgi:uncharacterized protein involved in exopolysaccharide biosynthesis
MDGQEYLVHVNGPDRLPSLRDVATPLFRHQRLMVLTFAILVAGTFLAVLLVPREYEAKMKLLVRRQRVDTAVTPGRDAAVATPGEVTEDELNSEVELLKSRDLLEKVVVANGLDVATSNHFWNRMFSHSAKTSAGQGASDAQKKISLAVQELETKLDVAPLRSTDLIQVTYSSRDPELAARVLRSLGDFYLEKTVAVHRPPGAFEFFQTETQHYDQQLQEAQGQLAKFDHDKGVADPEMEKQISLQKMAEFQATLSSTQVAIKETEKRSRAVEEQLATTPAQTVSQIRSAENPGLMQELKTTLLDLQLKRTELLQKFEPSYRPVQEVQKQIDQTLDAINKAQSSPDREETTDRNPAYEWLRAELTKSNAELATLHARAAETQNVIEQYRRQLSTIDTNGAAQANLVREVKEAESNDLLYKQKREEARISDALDRQRIVNVAIAEAATVPALPANSHRLLTLVAGIFVALLLSPGVAFAVDYFDQSLRTPDEVREVLQIPVLAALPEGNGNRHVS